MASLAQHLHTRMMGFESFEALRIKSTSVSYGELNREALKWAAMLQAAGAKREAIGIVGQRNFTSYYGILGTIFAGCYYTPLNPKYSSERLLGIAEAAGIRFLIGDAQEIEALSKVLTPQQMARFIVIGSESASSFSAPLSSDDSDLAYVLFTSGSTGQPKGVQVTHSNVLSFLQSMAHIYHLEAGFRASQVFDLSFDPSVSDMFFTWSHGGVLCVLPEDEQMAPQEFIRREKITFWNSVPSVASFLNRMGYLTPGAFPDLRYSMFCGEQFPQHIADAWRAAAPNSTIENLYGPTEATIYISRYCYEREARPFAFKNGIIPIGKVFHQHQVAIVDEHDQRVPSGQVGEIVFQGDQITKGYLQDEAKTKTSFVRFLWDEKEATWYRTGDLGFVNPDGDVECIGRKDSQIKLAGRRIEIGEIESVLSRHAELTDIVVVPVRDVQDIVTGCVAFVLREVSVDVQKRIRQESQTALERVFFPQKIITIKEFPLTQSGKIDRKMLAQLAKGG